jgi:hypothetical protein
MLIKKMVFALKKHHSVGVVHPHFGWGEMEEGAVGFILLG